MRQILSLGFCLLFSCSILGQESVRVSTDRSKNLSEVFNGTIQSESPGGIVLKATDGKTTTFSPLDILMVQYKHESLARLDFQMVYDRQLQAQTATSAKDQADRLKQAEIAATKLLDEAGRPAIVRYARFKLAQIRSDMARAAGKDSEILSTWKQTALEVKGGWEELPALKALAEIQESQGSADVLTTYETMSKLTGLPPVLAQRVGYLLAAQLLRKGKPADALARLKALPSSPETTLLVACANLGPAGKGVADLRQAMANATDGHLIAIACNHLGETLLADKNSDDAFWEFVRVEAQFPGDPAELARALFQLGTLYDTVAKDPKRATECLERLKSREFSSSPFQKKALQLKTPAA